MAMQKVGDICTCCSSKTQMKTTSHKDTPPRRLTRIGSNLTSNKSLIVLGCEYCDGDIIHKLAQKTTAKE